MAAGTLPEGLTCLPVDTTSRPVVIFCAFTVFFTLVFSFLTEGVVRTTDDLLAAGACAETGVLPVAILPEDAAVEACARLDAGLSDELFLLTVLLFPMPPLRDELLPNTLSEPV